MPKTTTNLLIRMNRHGAVLDVHVVDPRLSAPDVPGFRGRHIGEVVPPVSARRILAAAAQASDSGSIRMEQNVFSGDDTRSDLWFVPFGGQEVLIVGLNRAQHTQSADEIRELNRSLIALQAAASAIALSLNVDHVLETFTWEIQHLLRSRSAIVLQLSEDGDTLLYEKCDRFPCLADLEPTGEIPLDFLPLLARTVRERFTRQITRMEERMSPEQNLLRECKLEALLSVPVVFQDRTLGLVLAGAGGEKRHFTTQELAFAQLLTNQAAAALANAQLYEQSKRRLREQSVLRTAGSRIASTLDREAVLRHLAEQLCLAVAAAAARISTVDPEAWTTTVLVEYRAADVAGAPPMLDTVLEQGLVEETTFVHRGEPATWRLTSGALDGHMVAGIPLILAERVIGFAEVWDGRPRRTFDAEELALLRTIAQQGAVALEHARVHAQLQQNLRELATLNQVTQHISSTLDLPATLTLISENAQSLLNGMAAMIGLVDRVGGEIRFVSCTGDRARHVAGKSLSLNEGLMGWVARNGEALLSNDVTADRRYHSFFDDASGETTQSVVAAPLQAKGQTIGVIAVIDRVKGKFSADDLRRLQSLATPAATAIENANLYSRANEEIEARKVAEAELEMERAALARRVAERTRDLMLANEELARAAKLKDEFLANMSHELRTPLNAILGISETMLEGIQGAVTEQQERSLRVIEQSGQRLLSMIEDILDIAGIGSGELTIEPDYLSIETVANACMQFARREARQKEIALRIEVPDAPETVYADSRLFKQALVNLINNAVKFTPTGGSVGLKVWGDREYVYFTVWDTGIGIAAADLPRLFQPFVQLDGTLKRRFGGTGLGLYLVHRIAELHGGEIDVESEPGAGSRFTVAIPHKAQSDIAVERVEWIEAVPGEQSAHPTILLAEDDDANRSIFTDFLTMNGFQVIGTASGREAVDLCRDQMPDLVLMDLNMPGLGGIDAIRQIRKLREGQELPIVVLTAMSRDEDREACLAAGADDFLCKPVPLQTVKTTVERMLQGRDRKTRISDE